MKKILFLILLITFSCKKQEEKLVNIVKVDYVSIGTKYGKLYKFFDVQETTIKNDDFTIFVYKDSTNFKRTDTLKLYKTGKVIFNDIIAEDIQTKKIDYNKIIFLHKVYIPRNEGISVDNFSGEIIYLTDDGIIARYGTASNYISLYKPNIYSELHNKILQCKLDFKRHPKELPGLP